NDRLHRIFARLEQIDAALPIDVILMTGDLTDAGRSAEWSELLDALLLHPNLLERILILPGNHDLNVVDRSNPAKLDLPISPNRRLRRLRFLSAADLVQGDRVRIIDRTGRCVGKSLSQTLDPYRAEMTRFSDFAKPRLPRRLDDAWSTVFPMVVPPESHDGLG